MPLWLINLWLIVGWGFVVVGSVFIVVMAICIQDEERYKAEEEQNG